MTNHPRLTRFGLCVEPSEVTDSGKLGTAHETKYRTCNGRARVDISERANARKQYREGT